MFLLYVSNSCKTSNCPHTIRTWCLKSKLSMTNELYLNAITRDNQDYVLADTYLYSLDLDVFSHTVGSVN